MEVLESRAVSGLQSSCALKSYARSLEQAASRRHFNYADLVTAAG